MFKKKYMRQELNLTCRRKEGVGALQLGPSNATVALSFFLLSQQSAKPRSLITALEQTRAVKLERWLLSHPDKLPAKMRKETSFSDGVRWSAGTTSCPIN